MKSIAFAVPTWNRREAVLGLIEAALSPASGTDPIDVIVRDDGSTDGTLDALQELAVDTLARTRGRLHVVSTPTNTGYGSSLLALLRSAVSITDAVILCADDDIPLPAGAPVARSALDRFGADLLSTPVPSAGGSGFDRRSRRVRKAVAPELRAIAAHAPGLVLRTAALGDALDLLEQRLERDCDFARAYPQAVVALHLLTHGTAWWWDVPVVATGLELPTGIRDSTGDTYMAPVARWRQWVAMQDLLDDEISASSAGPRTRLRAIRSAEDVHLLPHLRTGLAERSEDALRFDRAARRTYRDGTIRRPLRWLWSLTRAPERQYLIARTGDLLRSRWNR